MSISLAGGLSLGGAAGYWDQEVSKAADTPRDTTIVRVVDPDLFLPLAIGRQLIELNLLCGCASATPDIRWAFAEADSLVITAASFFFRMDSQGTLPSVETTAFDGTVDQSVILQIGAGLQNFVNIQLVCTVTTAGTLQFRWAQNASNATPTIVLANSNMKSHRMGD